MRKHARLGIESKILNGKGAENLFERGNKIKKTSKI